jgi:hypothetical protein
MILAEDLGRWLSLIGSAAPLMPPAYVSHAAWEMPLRTVAVGEQIRRFNGHLHLPVR